MAYSNLADLKTRIHEDELIQLTDDAGIGVVDSALVDSLIQEADSLIDQFLNGVTALPLSTVPPVIKGISVDFTLYLVHFRREQIVPEGVKEQRELGLELLRLFQEGKMKIAEITPTISNSPTQIFGETVLDQF